MYFFTIITSNYIPKARVLVESLKKFNPQSIFFLVLCDSIPDEITIDAELFDNIICIEELNIPNFDSWIFKHSIVELCTAIKALSFLKIFEITQGEKIVYLDPDIAVFNTLEELEQLLDKNSIILTPHIYTPENLRDGIIDNEICALKHGVYNLGFIAIKMNNIGFDFLNWWNERLMNFCYDDIPNGLFTDQRWIELAPIFFNEVFIIRDPSYNLAPWNISTQKISISGRNIITINNRPLKFFHFSGYDSGACHTMLLKYCKNSEALLFKWYSYELEKKGQNKFEKIPWHYSFFSNGEQILMEYRIVYRNREDLITVFPHPAIVKKDIPCFYYWLKNEYPNERSPSISELRIKIDALNKIININDSEIADLNSRINNYEQSIVWQFTRKFHTFIIENIFPQGSARRVFYSRLLSFCRNSLIKVSSKKKIPSRYKLWIDENEPKENDLKYQKRNYNNFQYKPLISIILPVWETDKIFLTNAIESVIQQSYENWELCIVDGNSKQPHVKKVLTQYEKNDQIKVKFLNSNCGISGNTNEALLLATGEFVGFLDHDDELSPDALYEVVKLLNNKPNLEIIYSDNDKIDEYGIRQNPFFKPDWSLPFFLSTNYVFHFLICRKSLLKKVGGLIREYDGAQDHDLVLRMIEYTKPENIGHLQKVLYHWRMSKSSSSSGGYAKPYAYEAGKKAIEDYIKRRGINGKVSELDPGSYRIKYALQNKPNVGLVLVSQHYKSKDVNEFIKFLIDHTIYQIQCIFVPNSLLCDKKSYIVNYSRSYKEIFNLVKKEKIEYLIFFDCDELHRILNSPLKRDWIESFLEQYILFKSGVVGTGTPVFGDVVQGVYRPFGPIFCINSQLFQDYTKSNEISFNFYNLQMDLADYSYKNGYINIYTPFIAGNLVTRKSIAKYYLKFDEHPFFTQNMKYYLLDIVDESNRNFPYEISDLPEIKGDSLREKIASEYIRGEGIEIGALHQPLAIPKNVNIKYVDRLKSENLILHYPELKDCDVVQPDIIDDAQNLKTIGNDRYDFCIANHVLEHMSDPIGALLNWIRILKPGGILYFSVPDIENPLDNGRDLTTLEHFITDHLDSSDPRDFSHFVDCAKYWNKLSDDNEILRVARENYEKSYSIHYHTFNSKSMHDLLSYILSEKPDLFSILNFYENTINGTNEYIYILEKNTYLVNCLEILEKQTKVETSGPYIDVIVPVYNAYNDLIRCLFSLVKYQTNYRKILINDCSSDKNIHELFTLLKPYESNRFQLLENNENLGFVKTVNRGMQYSTHDVILLNSDTIVTEKWAEKIYNCAYSDNQIGTVTPFTNNGTICSIPEFMKNNSIPKGFTIDSYAKFIERLSFKEYYEIPTAVGFCMLIKSELIKKIGLFDDVGFKMGYGEENDYSMRAVNAGYRNVLCDNTFIFHKGEASFGATKTELAKKNMQLLIERYPNYLKIIADFVKNNPIEAFQTYIKSKERVWDITAQKRRIMFVLHHLGGGSEHHVLDLISGLEKWYICYVVRVLNNKVQLSEFNNDSKIDYEFRLLKPINWRTTTNDSYKSILQNILISFDIDLIHVQHLIGHTMDVFSLAKTFEIPIIYSVHDFYSVCPRINLLDENMTYCHPHNELKKCEECLKKSLKLSQSHIEDWRSQFQQAFEICDLIIAPSQATIDILGNYYPNILKKYKVIEHGHGKEIQEDHGLQPALNHRPIHIGYFGILVPLKGRKMFYNLAKSPEFNGKINWSIFGASDIHEMPGYYPDANITVHGQYGGYKELVQKVKEDPVDLVIFPSNCPETFSFTLSEAWAMGIPVIVPNVGALKERVENNGGGWIVNTNNLEELKNAITGIINNTDEYLRKKSEISNIKLKTLFEVVNEYNQIYSSIINGAPKKLGNEIGNTNRELYSAIINNVKDNEVTSAKILPKKIAQFFYKKLIMRPICRLEEELNKILSK